MDARNEAAAATNTSTFEPSSDLIQEEDCNTLLLYLPGFTKDQLRVQLTRTKMLKISGARPLGNNKTSTFQKDFPVAENCDASKITAKFEDGILYVRQPKIIQDKTQPPKIVDHPHPPTSTADDHIKQATPAMNSPLQTSRGEGAKKEEKKPAEDKTGADGGKKEEKKKKKPAAEENTGADGGKKEEKKKPAEEKTARTGAEKPDKGAGSSVAAAVEADYSRLNAASPAARLKAVKEKMTNVVLLLFVFALGIYVSKLPWFSKRAHD